MDFRNLFGIAAIILSATVFVHSLKSANAFPQGPNVSMENNPVISTGGSVSNGTSNLFTAPSDQMIVINDVLLSMAEDSCSSILTITTSSGSILGEVKLHSKKIDISGYSRAALTGPTQTQHAFNSGLPLPEGEMLEITESGGCNVSYTISGYYAHP
jgi:hypothetical protein